MQNLHIVVPAPLSPHKLFQLLWKAVETHDCNSVQRLVDTLVRSLSGNQTLATAAVMELVDVALRHGCSMEIRQALARLPGCTTVKAS